MVEKGFLETVKKELKQLKKDRKEITNDGEAFDYWFAINCTPGSDVPPEYLQVDGTGDKGVDAVWIDEENEEFIIFQGKWSSSGSRAISDTPIQKLSNSPGLLSDSKRCEKLKPEISEASDLFHQWVEDEGYKIHLIFATTGYLTTQAEEEFRHLEKKAKEKKDFKVSLFKIGELQEKRSFLRKEKPEKITLLIKNNELFFGKNGCTATIFAQSLKEEVEKNNPGIFEENVRRFLGYRKGSPNNDMKETLNNEPEKFWERNNGITIICDKFEPKRSRKEAKPLEIFKPQIVNGCQTATIILHQKKLSKKACVLAKIIVAPIPSDVEAITEATNKQAAVQDRDLRSKDSIHTNIADYFKQHSYYYDYIRGK